jgi:hypothetical protein
MLRRSAIPLVTIRLPLFKDPGPFTTVLVVSPAPLPVVIVPVVEPLVVVAVAVIRHSGGEESHQHHCHRRQQGGQPLLRRVEPPLGRCLLEDSGPQPALCRRTSVLFVSKTFVLVGIGT